MKEKKQNIIGLRIIKTVISIYIAITITNLRSSSMPLNAAISALLSTHSSLESSRNYGKNRVLGTLIGGIYALIFVFLVGKFKIKMFTNTYYLFLSLLMIPIIKTVLLFNLPGAVSSACIAFLISLITYISQEELKYIYVLNRIVDTFIGVIVAIIINHVLPDNRNKAEEKR